MRGGHDACQSLSSVDDVPRVGSRQSSAGSISNVHLKRYQTSNSLRAHRCASRRTTRCEASSLLVLNCARLLSGIDLNWFHFGESSRVWVDGRMVGGRALLSLLEGACIIWRSSNINLNFFRRSPTRCAVLSSLPSPLQLASIASSPLQYKREIDVHAFPNTFRFVQLI